MSAQEFFHGTVAPPADGTIRSRKELAPDDFSGLLSVNFDPETHTHTYNRDVAHATSSEGTAWRWAQTRAEDSGIFVNDMPRPSVLRVTAPDPEIPNRSPMMDFDGVHVVAPKFDVVGQEDIQPRNQGTLPLNWNQFRGQGSMGVPGMRDVNHPTPQDERARHLYTQRAAYKEHESRGGETPHQEIPGQLPLFGVSK